MPNKAAVITTLWAWGDGVTPLLYIKNPTGCHVMIRFN